MKENRKITMPDLTPEQALEILGTNDKHLDILKSYFDTAVSFRDNTFMVRECDEETEKCIHKVLDDLYAFVKDGKAVNEQTVHYACRMVLKNKEVNLESIQKKIVGRTLSGKAIMPKTQGQYEFVTAMEEKPIVFAIGPAGTGKTYLAVIEAVSALKNGDVKKIVLTRPAVEAGENLGFLPGDLKEKVDPYLMPLYDALHDMLGNEQTEKLEEKGTIEIAPLAYMRGRTLNNAFVILDEAQNTTKSQMKMFLTRLGFHSRMVITGDVTQVDLAKHVESGLTHAAQVLQGVDDIAILRLSGDDVVRHPLVQKIIERYEKYE